MIISLYIFLFFTFIILLYGTIKLEKKISDRMIEITTSDVISIVNNNALVIETFLNENSISDIKLIKNDSYLYKKIEDNLNLLLTSNIKYAYILYKDEQDIFRFFLDGSLIKEEKFLEIKSLI